MLPFASLLTTGCIIPEAPEYGSARQSPVFIEQSSIHPNPGSLLELTRSPSAPSVPLSMTVRSEDADTELVAPLFIDYKHDGGSFYVDPHLPPLTFDQPRLISISINLNDPRVSLGCHTFTMMVLHADGWDDSEQKRLKGNPSDLASVTWFASIGEEGSAPVPVTDCPNPSTETPTAP